MNYKDWLDAYKEDVMSALPRYTYYDFKVDHISVDKGGVYTGKAKTFLHAINTDGVVDTSARNVPYILADEFTISNYGRVLLRFIKQSDIHDEDGNTKVAVIDNLLVVPSDDYEVEVPSKRPEKLADSISSLLYYLYKGDVPSAYQLLGNISTETKNIVAENKFKGVKRSTNIDGRIPPCQL